MNFLPEYVLKLSISLAGVFLFYYFILRRLTFYNYNRWYLLGYTVLSFLIPFINISAVLQQNNWQQNGIVNWVPVINSETVTQAAVTGSGTWGAWQWTIAIITGGMLLMLCRLVLQLFSFKKMLRKAEPVSSNGMNLYQVNDNIIPFSFGNSIFINRHLHAANELEEIIRHEFVHVKQRHSFDIIWAELLCIINWYNPFVWLLKRSIRQNLEFIADHKVLENGIDKRSYQYLLLKVIGNNQYSIANQFNFSSLKKRIAMMNKSKSTKRQLIRLLFLLPATAVLLLAFRTKWNAAVNISPDNKKVAMTVVSAGSNNLIPLASANMQRDTTIKKSKPNSKGYIINVKNINGEDMVVVKDKAGKDVKSISVKEWDENEEKYEKIYGEATALPVTVPAVIEVAVPAEVNVIATTSSPVKVVTAVSSPAKVATASNLSVVEVARVNEVIEVPVTASVNVVATTSSPLKVVPAISSTVKVATAPNVSVVEVARVNEVVEVPAFRTVVEVPGTPAVLAKLPDNVKKVQIDNNKVTVWPKNGKKESFDLNNAEEKKELEKKYSIYAPGKPVPPVEQPAKGN